LVNKLQELILIPIRNSNFLVIGLIRPGLKPTIYRTRGEHTNHYTSSVVLTYNIIYSL